MNQKNNTGALKAIIIILLLIIVGWIIYDYSGTTANQTPATTAAGTTTPPTNTVSTSTSTLSSSNWQILSSSTTGVTFEYPAQLGTNYIQTVDWPPYITVATEAFACPQIGANLNPGGKTAEQIINGTTYCVTTESEGAAGSVYLTYGYGFQKAGKYMTLNFTIREPQCENYPDPKASQCTNEESSYDINGLADSMVQTVRYVPVVSPSQPSHPTSPAPSGALNLNSVSPGSGAVGTKITLTGSGFLDSNKVLFDGNVAEVNASPSLIANGYQTLIITVPSGIGPDCQPNQACPQYERLVTPGSYLITVENANGKTNAIPFIVEN